MHPNYLANLLLVLPAHRHPILYPPTMLERKVKMVFHQPCLLLQSQLASVLTSTHLPPHFLMCRFQVPLYHLWLLKQLKKKPAYYHIILPHILLENLILPSKIRLPPVLDHHRKRLYPKKKKKLLVRKVAPSSSNPHQPPPVKITIRNLLCLPLEKMKIILHPILSIPSL